MDVNSIRNLAAMFGYALDINEIKKVTSRNKAKPGMKAIGLIRVSTVSQDLKQQANEVKNMMLNDGYSEDDIILIEDKESAVKLSEEERQGLNTMKQYIESDPSIDCVYIYELSRLSRRPEVLYSIRNYLLDRKIQLVVLKPYMKLLDGDRISDAASIMFAIFGAMAEQEGYIRKERMARGKKQKQSLGKWAGGPLTYGYTIDSDNNIIIDEEKAKVVRYVFNEYAKGQRSTVSLGKELMETGEIGATNVNDAAVVVNAMLKNKSYIGGKQSYYSYSNKQVQTSGNIYPRIISDELFETVGNMLKAAKSKPKTEHKHIYYCKKLIKDSRTGYILSPKYTSASYAYSYKTLNEEHKLSIQINLIDSFIWHLTVQHAKQNNPEKIKKLIEETKRRYTLAAKKYEHMKETIDSFKDKEKKIQTRIITGKMNESIGDEMIKELHAQQKSAINSLAILEAEKDKYYKHLKLLMIGPTKYEAENITDDITRVQIINETIESVEIFKFNDKKRKRRQPMGTITVNYLNGEKETYYYNSYTKDIWDNDMRLISYEYLHRTNYLSRTKTN